MSFTFAWVDAQGYKLQLPSTSRDANGLSFEFSRLRACALYWIYFDKILFSLGVCLSVLLTIKANITLQ